MREFDTISLEQPPKYAQLSSISHALSCRYCHLMAMAHNFTHIYQMLNYWSISLEEASADTLLSDNTSLLQYSNGLVSHWLRASQVKFWISHISLLHWRATFAEVSPDSLSYCFSFIYAAGRSFRLIIGILYWQRITASFISMLFTTSVSPYRRLYMHDFQYCWGTIHWSLSKSKMINYRR